MKRLKLRAMQRLVQSTWDNRIQEEARIANEIQRDHPDIPRSEALRLAAVFIARVNLTEGQA